MVEKININQNLFSGPWNFGPPQKSNEPVKYICETMVDIWGDDAKWIVKDSNNKYHEANLLMLDSSKSMKKLNGLQNLILMTPFKRTINWYKRYYSGSDMLDFTKHEIYNYMK